jgi:DNA-binding MarR family transcriptional regulator
MERDGLINRQYEPGNRRSLQVFLTPKGHEAMQYVEEVHQLIEKESFCDFTEKEKEQAKALLERIFNNLKKAEDD